ncbi:sugar transferase [Oleisolibacter albus]|uniref:sugar transferase n=1 Tax=Oleisolibacter albus TaxID=2171757 RepID=UPI0019613955|nr:sugar transferase [Oleisolibacter albus]
MTQALSTEDRAIDQEPVVVAERPAQGRRARYGLFQVSQFGIELTMMATLTALVSWLLPSRILPADLGSATAVQSGVMAVLLLLPVWHLAQGLYRSGAPVAAVRVQRRLAAVAAAFSLVAAQAVLTSSGPAGLLLPLTLLLVSLTVGLVMEGMVRPMLAGLFRARVPTLLLGDTGFRQTGADLLTAGADFGGMVLARASMDDTSLSWPDPAGRGKAMPAATGPVTAVLLPAPARPDGAIMDLHDLGGFVGLVYRRRQANPVAMAVKIALDKLVAGTALLAFLPALLAIMAALKLTSPGPVFYSQTRIGQHGRPFRMWKFRTMRVDAEQHLQAYLDTNPDALQEWKTYFKLKKDPRIIPGVGSFLRRSSLDELPQLFNVLNGSMSLVGPRPFPTYHLDQFPQDFQRLRATVRPGMTGFWQISARSDGDLRVQEALDSYYIRNWSIWLDLHIIATTPYAMLASKGAY